jgi:hypothetical protein
MRHTERERCGTAYGNVGENARYGFDPFTLSVVDVKVT